MGRGREGERGRRRGRGRGRMRGKGRKKGMGKRKEKGKGKEKRKRKGRRRRRRRGRGREGKGEGEEEGKGKEKGNKREIKDRYTKAERIFRFEGRELGLVRRSDDLTEKAKVCKLLGSRYIREVGLSKPVNKGRAQERVFVNVVLVFYSTQYIKFVVNVLDDFIKLIFIYLEVQFLGYFFIFGS